MVQVHKEKTSFPFPHLRHRENEYICCSQVREMAKFLFVAPKNTENTITSHETRKGQFIFCEM